jgi:hypothetical protein
VLLAILEESAVLELLADANFYRSNVVTALGHYLYDYADEELGSVAALARANRNRGRMTHRLLPLWARANAESSAVSTGGTGHTTRPEVAENDAEAQARLDDLNDPWIDFSMAVDETLYDGAPTTPVGMLIMYGGSAALRLVDKLVSGGFKLQPDARRGEPLLASVVHHFFNRCWVETQLQVENPKAIDSFRRVLSWLADKSDDDLRMNCLTS